ncbi:hypothetical protein KIN20_037201 [Parelaphostrongylus tenuis]|uniref:Uncharacterized protein n=1 Tax=Parelaphostrongylus tenuis TaxID=148309 RepID=A0AAD5RDM0_PARTN|nr:hypothetical protein KIN20_037201 [Parelaphostrongylus tenuis]
MGAQSTRSHILERLIWHGTTIKVSIRLKFRGRLLLQSDLDLSRLFTSVAFVTIWDFTITSSRIAGSTIIGALARIFREYPQRRILCRGSLLRDHDPLACKQQYGSLCE